MVYLIRYHFQILNVVILYNNVETSKRYLKDVYLLFFLEHESACVKKHEQEMKIAFAVQRFVYLSDFVEINFYDK